MKTPPHEDRLQIWRYAYARASLNDAISGFEILLDPARSQKLEKQARKAVLEHSIISYARPFTACRLRALAKKEPLISSTLVPPECQGLHDQLMETRHTVIGHKDAEAFPDTVLNRVVMFSDADGFFLATVSIGDIEPHVLAANIDLCKRLVAECEKALEPHIKKHLLITGRPTDGAFLISTASSPTDWLQQVDWPQKK